MGTRKELWDYTNLCDFPIYKHRFVKRRCYWVCIVENGGSLKERLRLLLKRVDTTEVIQDIGRWCFRNKMDIPEPKSAWQQVSKLLEKLKEDDRIDTFRDEVQHPNEKRIFRVDIMDSLEKRLRSTRKPQDN